MPRKSGQEVSRDHVVRAAAAVLQRDGYDGLTMRAVAEEIGVRAPSLYWHVRSKDDLSLLLFDHLIDDLDWGEPTSDWREDLKRMAARLRERLVTVRDITRLFPERYAAGPRARRSLEAGLGALRRAGLSPAEALYAYSAALSFIVGWSRFEVTRRENSALTPPPHSPSEPPDLTAMPNLVWALSSGYIDTDYDAGFTYGVELLLAGLEARLRT